MGYKLILRDAFWQLLGRLISAGAGFFVITMMSPYLGPLRYGDYSTILKYFAIRSALADFGLYVIALKDLGKIKHEQESSGSSNHTLSLYYSKFVSSRLIVAMIVYSLALIIAYLIPAYTANPYIVIGLPLGMIFSASFVASGITQLPFQLYRKMHHVTIAMIVARITQLVVLGLTIVIRFPSPEVTFSDTPDASALWAFGLILCSVVCSALMQFLYTLRKGGTILPLRLHIDWSFSRTLVRRNAQYGFAYFLSSFHTLIVLIMLSVMYPTIQGYTYVGIWGLALSFVEMLLIIPPSIANGVMHKSAHYSLPQKQKSYGNLMALMMWIAIVIGLVLALFSHEIIWIVAGSKYLSSSIQTGSDLLLPWFGIVLMLNFIKQVMNYVFVSTELHNNLLRVNGLGVIVGTSIGRVLILYGNIVGGIATQIILETLFVGGALWIGRHHRVLPTIPRMIVLRLASIVGVIGLITWYAISIRGAQYSVGGSMVIGAACVGLISIASWRSVKQLMQGLSREESAGLSDLS